MNIKLKEYDILGINPHLYVDSDKRRKTEIGGFTSIILIVILLTAICYFFFDVFARNSFVVIYNRTTMTQPMLNLTEFPIGVALFDGKANLIDIEGQATIHAEFHQISSFAFGKKPVQKITKINLERCNKDIHFGAHKEILSNNPILEKYWCIPTGKHNLTLYGNWADSANPNSYLVFKISKCLDNNKDLDAKNQANNTNFENLDKYTNANISDNSFVNKVCQEKSIIKKNLLQIYLNMFFLDYDIDHNNYETPGRLIQRSETFSLSSTSYSSYYLRKKIVKYQTDFGFLLTKIKNEFFFQEDTLSMITDLSSIDSPTATFGNINISLSKKTDVFFRGYVKIQSALANIGGIVEGIFFAFSFLMKFLMKESYYKELGKSAYLFAPEPSKKLNFFQPFKFKDLKKNLRQTEKNEFTNNNKFLNENDKNKIDINVEQQRNRDKK